MLHLHHSQLVSTTTPPSLSQVPPLSRRLLPLPLSPSTSQLSSSVPQLSGSLSHLPLQVPPFTQLSALPTQLAQFTQVQESQPPPQVKLDQLAPVTQPSHHQLNSPVLPLTSRSAVVSSPLSVLSLFFCKMF